MCTINFAMHYDNKYYPKIDKATNVVIVGGGAVGVELAGEIAERYSAKLVSIIHKRSYLVSPSYGDQFQRKVKNVLKDRSVQALLGRSLSDLVHRKAFR